MRKAKKLKLERNIEIIAKIVDYNSIEGNLECIDYLNSLYGTLEDRNLKTVLGNLLVSTNESGFLTKEQVRILEKECQKLPITKEVVFLPYKASMWDAMESVYLQAINDARVEVKVMPIPYTSFDKKTGITHYHYEGSEFEHLKEYTNYECYDIAEEKPDIVFIHNPYDEMNLVTRVAEQYFSSNLIRYTDHLVYIPYDVAVGDSIDNNFCLMPGTRNAWRVFVQSERVREQYLKSNDKDKIVALGSPKIDAVVNHTKATVVVPKSWEEKIQNRKVILFNTHLASLLSEANENIERIRCIGDYFGEHPEWVLLWRPHPLSVQTAEALNPQFLDKYMNLVAYMKMIPNIIYDDTSDMDRAIAISDAYVGDHSSLVMLYGFTGKPIYLHSALKNRAIDNDIYCIDAAILQNDLWVPHMNYNSLFRIDLSNLKIEENIRIPECGRNREVLFGNVYSYEQRLLLVPYTADNFVWYDIRDKSFSVVHYEASTNIKNFCAITVDDDIFLFAFCMGNQNIRIDMKRQKIQSFDIDKSKLKELIHIPYDFVWGNKGTYANNKCWLVLRQSNGIVSISKEGAINYFPVVADGKGFREIIYDGENFWLIPQIGTEILCWNESEGVKRRYCEDTNQYKGCAYEGIVYSENTIWIIPSCARYILKISKKLDEITKIQIPIEINEDGKGMIIFSGYQCIGNHIYLFPFGISSLVEFDIDTQEFLCREIKMIENKWKREFYSANADSQNCDVYDYIYRDSLFTLDEFLNDVKMDTFERQQKRKHSFDSNVANSDGTAGVKIWKAIMDQMHGEQ